MAHDHADAHPSPGDHNAAFAVGVALNVGFVAVEVVFGLLGDSLALLADAGHNLSDVLGLLLAWGAAYLATRPTSDRRTYGWRRSSILAALANALLLMVAIGAIAWEAIRRFAEPGPVAGWTVIWVALVGTAINGVTAWLFFAGRKGDLNIRGAFLHMAADAGVSLGVVVAGVMILLTGWWWIDPAVSLLIVLVIFVGIWGLLRDSFNLAMDAVPPEINTAAVRRYLTDLPGVAAVHDLHIWPMSTTETALTAHLVKPDPAGDDALLGRLRGELHERHGIDHVTVQWERDLADPACGRQCEDATV